MFRRQSLTQTLTVLIAILLTAATAHSQSLTVSATAGATDPTWAEIGEETTTPVSASLSNPPTFVTGPMYNWSFPAVSYSPDNILSNPATSGYYAYFEDPNAAQTNFKAIGYNAGYWHFSLLVQVTGSVFMGYGYGTTPVFGSATCGADPVVAGPLTIKRQKDGGNAYEVIGATNKNVLPGELMDLKAEDSADATAVLAETKWTIPAKAFKDYTSTSKKAVLTGLSDTDVSLPTVKFYWADSGDKEVKVTGKVGGKPRLGKATISVKKSTATLTATQGDVYVGQYTLQAKKYTCLILAKDNTGGLPGIEFTGKVSLDAGFSAGTWCYAQLIKSKVTMTVTTGDVTINTVRTTDGKYVMDDPFPYGSQTYATGNTARTDNDSPNVKLDQLDALQAAGVPRDDFQMYILFKPDGANSKYVPPNAT